jgi:hypothetical protein
MSLYFVDPARGNDGNDGTSQEKPFKTIERAIPELGAGDVLRLHAGTVYGPSIVFPREMAGSAEEPIVVEPYAGTEVTFDGRITDPALSVAPNNLWERAPGEHPDEWRTRKTLDEPQPGNREQSRVRYGAFADTRLRLITYSKIQDLRATNESFHNVPLSDPRPAGGPLQDDPARKTPWTYLGPGLRWVFENPEDPEDRRGRVHVRLSPTNLNASGTQDYAGPVDPNEVALALTPEGRVVLRVGASNVEFRHVVIANGGTLTLNVTEHARNITFDHCALYGGRFGMRVSGNADGVTFKHCTFDGALAPWTVRSDVKSRYTYIDPDLGPVDNVMGNETHDILAISHAADNVEFAHCTFRRGHDALQIGGTNVSVHHSLFEDLNDEVLQFNVTLNAHIYKNLIRQALNPLSFALKVPGGPVYIYRNVIDQRVPTRGYRRLPPDAPAPLIWRYGTSYKMGLRKPTPENPGPTMPDVYVYQNTFIASHPDDKASVLSALFASGELSPVARRIHLNNLLVGLNLDMPYSWAMPTSANRRSAGNLWYEPHQIDAPLFQFQRPNGSVERVETVAELRELDAAWELKSRFAEPRLANFDDEFFDHGLYLGDAYPDNDFRPAPGSPAAAAGVVLPPDLTDPDRPADDARPDIGALSSASPPFAVGVDDAVVLPATGNPIAHAGPDQTVIDGDGDGFESVTIDGSESVDAGGAITAYAWILGGVRIASQPIATLFLPEGDYYAVAPGPLPSTASRPTTARSPRRSGPSSAARGTACQHG